MANKIESVSPTKSTFQIRGKVFGTSKDKFYVDKKTTTGKPWRNISFGIQTNKHENVFVQFNGMEQEQVYFSGRDSEKNVDTVKVAWKDRFTFKKEGYRLIGVNCGLEKTTDDKGKEVNDKKMLTPFDAAKYVSEHLQDGMWVFVKGTMEYGHYTTSNGEVAHSVKLIPNQISLCQEHDFDEVDKDGNGYSVVSDFTQFLVYTGIEKDQEQAGKFNLSAIIVNYNSLENAEFVVEDEKLAKNFKTRIKPYTGIKTWGKIKSVSITETVVSESGDDGWGEKNPMDRVNTPYKTIRVITGADPSSFNVTDYTESKIEKAMEEAKALEKKEKRFESQSDKEDDWGGGKKPTEDEDSPW